MSDIYVGSTTVHATVADGSVWFSKSNCAPRKFTKNPSDFLNSSYCSNIQEMRIFALISNSELIRDAYTAGITNGFRVLIASPLGLHTQAARQHPQTVITQSMALTNALFSVSPSSGGWHELLAQEQTIYTAASQLANNDEPAAVIATLAGHPLWLRLKFISPCSDAALAQIIAMLRDPRWYINPQHPSKMRRLYNYMGFNPMHGDITAAERKELAIAVWRTDAKVPAGISKHPRGFLWRHYYKLASSGSQVKAELATTGLFLRFLRSVWLDVIAEDNPHIAEPLFVPDYFFDWSFPKDTFSAEIAESYKRYTVGLLKTKIGTDG